MKALKGRKLEIWISLVKEWKELKLTPRLWDWKMILSVISKDVGFDFISCWGSEQINSVEDMLDLTWMEHLTRLRDGGKLDVFRNKEMEVRWAERAGKTNLWKYKHNRVKRKAKVLKGQCSTHWCDEDDESTEKRKQQLPWGKRTPKA